MAVILAIPAAAQAAPFWLINGRGAFEPGVPEPTIYSGRIEWRNPELKTLVCKHFLAGGVWNAFKEGTERGLQNTVGFGTWECKAPGPGPTCEVVNEQGVQKEGTFLSAEGSPTFQEAKKEARRTGNTSLPWSGELTEKEPEAGKKARYLLTHHVKLWLVVPLDEKQGGPGKGALCELLGGDEIAFEDQEGATEKAAGDQLVPRYVNGIKNGLNPSHLVLGGEKTEKGEALETGRLWSPLFGSLYATGELYSAGATDFELVTAE